MPDNTTPTTAAGLTGVFFGAEMTPTETAALLRQFNGWRRDFEDKFEQPDPHEVSEAIDTAIEMIERLEAAENDAHQKALAASALRVAEGWERKCGELRAKIEAMEKQEPVGQFIQHPSNGLWEQDGYGDNPDARPLYALPGVKGEEK